MKIRLNKKIIDYVLSRLPVVMMLIGPEDFVDWGNAKSKVSNGRQSAYVPLDAIVRFIKGSLKHGEIPMTDHIFFELCGIYARAMGSRENLPVHPDSNYVVVADNGAGNRIANVKIFRQLLQDERINKLFYFNTEYYSGIRACKYFVEEGLGIGPVPSQYAELIISVSKEIGNLQSALNIVDKKNAMYNLLDHRDNWGPYRRY